MLRGRLRWRARVKARAASTASACSATCIARVKEELRRITLQRLRSFGWLLAGVAGVGLLGAIFAAQSGEAYKETLEATGQTITSTLEDHAEMGDAAQGFAAVFFALLAVWVLFAWWRRRSGEEKVTAVVKQPKVIAIILSVLVVVSGIAATASVTVTGHSGAKSVWESKK